VAVHDVGEGGLAVAAAEMAIDSGVGAQINYHSDHIAMFNESGGRVLAVVQDELLDAFMTDASEHEVPVREIGRTGGSSLNFGSEITIPLNDLEHACRNELPEALGRGTISA
jgi:phosphoribosylformylglycinamidine synthase